jgi:putative endonuclease
MSENFSIINDKRFDGMSSSVFGARGEQLALEFLLRSGYRIVCANFKTPVGRNRRGAIITGEIDLIAYDAKELCFIEVKTRSSDEYASPFSAINLRKQRQITRAARKYREIFSLRRVKFRYDAVSVIINRHITSPRIELIKGFWTETKFRKAHWSGEF